MQRFKPYTSSMVMRRIPCVLAALALVLMLRATASAGRFFFSTGKPDGLIASVSHPEGRHETEHESADDFILTSHTLLQKATFTGLLFHGGPGEIRDVVVELYHVFPKDSNTMRTPNVPTRTNSPGDKRFDARSSEDGSLRFTVKLLDSHFEANNSVIEKIFPLPNQTTGGEGRVAGHEVRIDVEFMRPFDLPADQYFFVPQVLLEGECGTFLWLSARFAEFRGDLQLWVRQETLKPDWLRVGQDIVGPTPASGPKFNGSFSLSGVTVP